MPTKLMQIEDKSKVVLLINVDHIQYVCSHIRNVENSLKTEEWIKVYLSGGKEIILNLTLEEFNEIASNFYSVYGRKNG